MNSTQIIEKLKEFILVQLTENQSSSPALCFMQPIIKRALNKNIGKVSKYLDYISDENGNIDIDNIITEITENLMNTAPFDLDVPVIGKVKIGGGIIKMDIPYTSKEMSFNSQDLIKLKESFNSN